MHKIATSISVLIIGIVPVGVFALVQTLPYGAQSVPVKEKPEIIPGKYIVVLKNDKLPKIGERQKKGPAKQVATNASKFAAGDNQKQHTFKADKIFSKVFDGFAASLTDAEVQDLKNDPAVAYIMEDEVVRGFSGGTQATSTGVRRIAADGLTNKGTDVEVAVLDTGIDMSHPDLATNIAGSYNCSGLATTTDVYGHGTSVAGIIAALDNNIGVVGVAPEAKMWNVKVLGDNGFGSSSTIICGLDFVTAHAPANGGNITVANLSLGSSPSSVPRSDDNCGLTNSDALHQAICRTRDAGVVIVVAAGNNSGDAAYITPAAYDDAVITVSALKDRDGQPGGLSYYYDEDAFANFSNYGSAVDIGAPGYSVQSTYPVVSQYCPDCNGYTYFAGTSAAAPHVAGAAALYIAQHPGASWTSVRNALVSTGELPGQGHYGFSTNDGATYWHPEPVLWLGTSTLPSVSLTVTDRYPVQPYRLVSGGSTVVIGDVNFHARGDAILLESIRLALSSLSASSSDISSISIWDDSTLVGTTTFGASEYEATSVLTEPILIPQEGNKSLTIRANVAPVGIGQPGHAGNLLRVTIDTNSDGTYGTAQTSSSTVMAIGTTTSNGVRVFKSFPTFAGHELPYPAILTEGIENRLFRFSVTADSAGPIGLRKVHMFHSILPGELALYAYTDPSFSTPITGQGANGQIGTTISVTATSSAVAFTPSSQAIQVPAGGTYYFELRGTFPSLAANELFRTPLYDDASYATSTSYSSISSNFIIWSPNDFGTTTLSSDSDWTNGYRLPGLPRNGYIQDLRPTPSLSVTSVNPYSSKWNVTFTYTNAPTSISTTTTPTRQTLPSRIAFIRNADGVDYIATPDSQIINAEAGTTTFPMNGGPDGVYTAKMYKSGDPLKLAYATSTFIIGSANYAQCVSHTIPAIMSAGATTSVSITMKNTGTKTWTNNPPGSATGDYDIAQPSPSSPAMTPTGIFSLPGGSSVDPGSNATFTFTLTAPSTAGTYSANYKMLEENVGWFGDLCGQTSVVVTGASTSVASLTIAPSMVATSSPARGTVTLSSAAPAGGISVSLSSSDTNLATVPASVTIPQNATSTTFLITGQTVATSSAAVITATYGSSNATSSVQVVPLANLTSNAQCAANTIPSTMSVSEARSVSVSFLNSGTRAWTNNPPGSATGDFDTAQPSPSSPAMTPTGLFSLPGGLVLPGESATFTFTLTAPSTAGTYSANYKMLEENVGWFGDLCGQASISVAPVVAVSSVSVNPGYAATSSPARGSVTINTAAPAGGMVVNLSSSDTGAITVPATVTVPQGATSTTFTVTGKTTSATSSVTISASIGGTGTTTTSVSNVPFGNLSSNAQCMSHDIAATWATNTANTVNIVFKNIGTRTWTNNPPGSATGDFDTAQPSPSSPAMTPTGLFNLPAGFVVPNESATFQFTMTSPSTAGTYSANYKMLEENVGWFGDLCGQASVVVQ